MKLLLIILPLMVLAACDNMNPPAREAWLGKWTGPEGTYLDLRRDGAAYDVAIRDLDGEKVYPAVEVDGTIQFERDGVGETIRAGNGEQTGMKWLADKQNCLVVKAGEGYCRD